MKIHCFGDSWTHGIGVEWEPGRGPVPMEDRYDLNWDNERFKYSWPGQLRTKLNNKYTINNFGTAGFSNYEIYCEIIQRIKNKEIKKDDLVIVAFSSIIREPLNFLTMANYDEYGFINYSNAVHIAPLQEYPNWIVRIEDKKLKEAAIENYMDFIVNRINYNFLYEIVMNYVCNLQIFLEKLEINYIFVNAFENVISDKVFFYNQIKKENWVLFNYTLSEYLIDRSKELDSSLPYSVWEDDFKDVQKCSDGPHPNRIGYGFIAELLYDEIIKRNILKDASII